MGNEGKYPKTAQPPPDADPGLSLSWRVHFHQPHGGTGSISEIYQKSC